MPRVEIAGDICWRRPGPSQVCTADDDDNDDDEEYEDVDWTHLAPSSVEWWPLVTLAIYMAVS